MNTKFWTAFASIEQLDSTFIRRLYNYFGDIETAFNANLSDLQQIEGLSVTKAKNFLEKKKNVNPEQTLDLILNKNIKILTFEDENYPYMLRQIPDPPMTLFDKDMTLHDPTAWLKNKILSPSDRQELSIDNLKTVLTKLLEEKVEIINEGSEVYFVEKGFKLTMKELSEGYRSTIIFVCDLLTKLSERCGDNENVFEQPGVVMIDEICQHLHPRWQRTVVKKLRKLFPNIQFVMTTHSPVIVLGASDDAIFYRVIREKGNTSVSEPYYRSKMNDWMLNTLITSSLFGMDSAAMDGADPMGIDTNSSYVLSRIMKCVDAKLAEQKQNGRVFFTDEELDAIINPILESEQI
ncbi:MAG: AAA family ATPase [bacterium]|nr:AAA family ATPase [bacterium]